MNKFSWKMINCDIKPPEKRRVFEFPNVMTCAIIGPSGSGKTNILINILAHIELPKNIYLYALKQQIRKNTNF